MVGKLAATALEMEVLTSILVLSKKMLQQQVAYVSYLNLKVFLCHKL